MFLRWSRIARRPSTSLRAAIAPMAVCAELTLRREGLSWNSGDQEIRWRSRVQLMALACVVQKLLRAAITNGATAPSNGSRLRFYPIQSSVLNDATCD